MQCRVTSQANPANEENNQAVNFYRPLYNGVLLHYANQEFGLSATNRLLQSL